MHSIPVWSNSYRRNSPRLSGRKIALSGDISLIRADGPVPPLDPKGRMVSNQQSEDVHGAIWRIQDVLSVRARWEVALHGSDDRWRGTIVSTCTDSTVLYSFFAESVKNFE